MIAVTGVPRSGTSLIMQCVKEMDVEVVGNERPDSRGMERRAERANELNPQGFYETRNVMRGYINEEDCQEFEGKAVKIIFPGFGITPLGCVEKAILCLRDPIRIMVSQSRLVSGVEIFTTVPTYAPEWLRIKQNRYVAMMGYFCLWAKDNNVFWDKTLTVDYDNMAQDHETIITEIAAFLEKDPSNAISAFNQALTNRLEIPEDINPADFELSYKIYNAMKSRIISEELVEEIRQFRLNKALSRIRWVDEDHGTWLMINESLERSLETNNKGIKDKLVASVGNRKPIFKCPYFAKSPESYTIKNHTRQKVFCMKHEDHRTLENCYRCGER